MEPYWDYRASMVLALMSVPLTVTTQQSKRQLGNFYCALEILKNNDDNQMKWLFSEQTNIIKAWTLPESKKEREWEREREIKRDVQSAKEEASS